MLVENAHHSPVLLLKLNRANSSLKAIVALIIKIYYSVVLNTESKYFWAYKKNKNRRWIQRRHCVYFFVSWESFSSQSNKILIFACVKSLSTARNLITSAYICTLIRTHTASTLECALFLRCFFSVSSLHWVFVCVFLWSVTTFVVQTVYKSKRNNGIVHSKLTKLYIWCVWSAEYICKCFFFLFSISEFFFYHALPSGGDIPAWNQPLGTERWKSYKWRVAYHFAKRE